MKTLEVELALMKHFDFTQKIIVPNITHVSRMLSFETDLLVLTKASYAHGVEIKVSLQDFKKDFNKSHIKRLNHQQYFKRDFRKLKHFSYAFPERLLEFAKENVDPRFGLYSLKKIATELYGDMTIVKEVRKPKTLFNYKWTDQERTKLMHLGCMRIYNLKKRQLK